MNTVVSKDGTTIAYDQTGQGDALILVGGALSSRSHTRVNTLVALLSPHFTVIDYDRRGRGDSTDTLPYAVAREVEDIAALISAVGGNALLYGMSSGAVLALEAAAALGNAVTKLAIHEPPLILDDSRPPLPADYVEQINAAVAQGDRGLAVEIFMTKALLIPAEFLTYMKNPPPPEPDADPAMQPPAWSDMENVAHTLAYDGMIVRDYEQGKPLHDGQWRNISAPTLVITGEHSEPFFHDGARALVNHLPHAEHRLLAGQQHNVSPEALAPLLIEFLQA